MTVTGGTFKSTALALCENQIMTGIRAQRRQRLDQQILEAGRAQLADVGAAALSVRAIARELGLASSAVYRYVASRDELLTRLVVAAYDDLGDHVDQAANSDDGEPATRLRRALHAFRDWAVTHRSEFALLYGSPVPGYHAPAEQTTAPGTRVIALLLHLAAEAGPAPTPTTRVSEPLAAELRAITAEFSVPLDEAATIAVVALWTWLIGAVGQEVFDGFGTDTFVDPAAVFEAQLEWQLAGIFRR